MKKRILQLKKGQGDTIKSKTDFHRGPWRKGASENHQTRGGK